MVRRRLLLYVPGSKISTESRSVPSLSPVAPPATITLPSDISMQSMLVLATTRSPTGVQPRSTLSCKKVTFLKELIGRIRTELYIIQKHSIEKCSCTRSITYAREDACPELWLGLQSNKKNHICT